MLCLCMNLMKAMGAARVIAAYSTAKLKWQHGKAGALDSCLDGVRAASKLEHTGVQLLWQGPGG